MCMQNLVRFCQGILKIMNGNKMSEGRNNGTTEGQGESSFSKPGYNKKNIKSFLLKIFNFYNLKNLQILHGQVFVMVNLVQPLFLKDGCL